MHAIPWRPWRPALRWRPTLRWNLRQRLAFGFGVLVALLLVLAAQALLQTRELGAQLSRIVEVHNARAGMAQGLNAAQLDWMGQLRALVVLTDAEDLKIQQAALAAARGHYEQAEQALAAAAEPADLLAAQLGALQGPINAYFDKVLVNAEEPELRAARLALVQRVAALPAAVADLSKLQGF